MNEHSDFSGTADQWVDLSIPLSEDMPRWHVGFERVPNTISHQLSVIHLPVHCATHLDAPLHYVQDGASIEQFPLEWTISDALVLDLTHIQANQRIEEEHIVPLMPKRPPLAVLLRTDWPERTWRTPAFWADAPWLSDDAAAFLADCGIRIIGYDFPQEYAIRNIASGKAVMADFTVHLIMLSRGVWQLEYLMNLRALPSPRVQLLVCPLPLVGVEGSPVRVLAVPQRRHAGE